MRRCCPCGPYRCWRSRSRGRWPGPARDRRCFPPTRRCRPLETCRSILLPSLKLRRAAGACEAGNQTSILMSESLVGFKVAATRQKDGRLAYTAPPRPAPPRLATGGVNAPAATVWAAVMVVSGRARAVRPSQDAAPAAVWTARVWNVATLNSAPMNVAAVSRKPLERRFMASSTDGRHHTPGARPRRAERAPGVLHSRRGLSLHSS